MNRNKLREAEKWFFETYPGGFTHPEMQALVRKHKPEKMTELARRSFAREKFTNRDEILENMVKVINRSSMISLFEKPKFREYANSLNAADTIRLVTGLEKFLYDDEETGFNMIAESLKNGQLAKWSIVTVCPFYFRPEAEVFIKPTTVKNVIQIFELEGLIYKPTPSYSFYQGYREAFNLMKREVDNSLSPDNGHFSGFLMMAMSNFQ